MEGRLDVAGRDVTLKVADKTFACRRKVLADCSPYFDAMFNSDFIEKEKKIIEIKGVDTDAMDVLLQFTEASNVDILRSADVLSVLQAACMLQFEAVKENCIDMIMKEWLSVDTCLQIFHTARELDLCGLRNSGMAIALWEFSHVKKTSAFLQLPILDLEAYLQDDGLNVSRGEFEVFDAGISWVEEVIAERAEFLVRVLQCVRFVGVESHDVQKILLYPLIAENVQCVQLLECIYDMKSSTAREVCRDMSIDGDTSVKLERDSLLEVPQDLAQLPLAGSALGCSERLRQCTSFSGTNTETSRNTCLDDCPPACAGSCSDWPERNWDDGGSEDCNVPSAPSPSCRSDAEVPGQRWDTATREAARKLLQQPSRRWPVRPCVVGNMSVREDDGYNLPSAKPFVFCYDESKGDLVPVVQLEKIYDGPVTISGYKIIGRGPYVYLIGGELVLGHGSWNRRVWRYSLLTESWEYETNIPSVRRHHSVCFLEDDLYVIGGFGRHRIIMSSVEKYNVTMKKWKKCARLPQPIYSAACVAHKGQILVFSHEIFLYNPECDMWTSMDLRTNCTCLGFISARSHEDTIYLLGSPMHAYGAFPTSKKVAGCGRSMLARYQPSLSTAEEVQIIEYVGNFAHRADDMCIVGDKIYSFSADDKQYAMFMEVFCIKEKRFQVVWRSADSAVKFTRLRKWSCSFPLIKY